MTLKEARGAVLAKYPQAVTRLVWNPSLVCHCYQTFDKKGRHGAPLGDQIPSTAQKARLRAWISAAERIQKEVQHG